MNRARNVSRVAAVAALVALVVAIGSVVGDTAVTAQSPAEAEEAQVRVSAKRLANGSVELAVQIETQGQWMPRVLPETRWLPTSVRADRWRSSASVNLSSGHEVEISVRRLASGEVELGLHEVVDGERQERQLPETRLLPADQEVDEWWDSSPLMLPERLSEATHVPLLRDGKWLSSTLEYVSHFDHNGTITTWTATQPTTGGEWATADFAGVLRIGCYTSDNFSIGIQGIAPLEADSVAITLTIDDLTFPTQNWSVWTHHEGDEAVVSNLHPPDSRRLFRLLRDAKELSAEIEGFEGTRTWDISQTLTTPVQANLEHCGNYVEGYIDPPPPPTYVPLVNANGWLGNVRYQSRLGDDGSVWAETGTYPDYGDLFLKIGTSAHGEHFYVLVDQLPPLDVEQVSVVWSLDDGDSVEEQWRVENIEGSHSSVSPPDRPGFYNQLRGASSFTFEVKDADTGSVMFDLTDTFSTPVQLNIDERGNWVEGQSREPVYDYVPITNASGSGSGRLDWSAATHGNRLVNTYVNRTTDVEGAVDGRLTLKLGCHDQSSLDIHIREVSSSPEESGAVSVTLQIDDGEPFVQTWWQGDSAATGVWSPWHLRGRLYERLRGKSSVTIEVADSGLGPVTFDLTGMFDTPVQENIDQCGMYNPHGHTREIEYDYVPVVGLRGSTSGGAEYGSNLNDDGTVYTYVVDAYGAPDGSFDQFSMACGSTSPETSVTLAGLPLLEGDQIELTIQIDDDPAITATWGYHGSEGWRAAFPSDRAAFLSSLRGATTVTFTASEHGYGPVTFNVGGFFDTPVQENFDNCGEYKRGAWRQGETPQPEPVDVDPADQETTVSAGRNLGLGALDSVWLNESYPWVDGERLLALVVLCGPQGARVVLSGTLVDGLSGDEALVEWSLDDGPIQSEYWSITTRFGGTDKRLSPSDARATIAAWRNAAQLDMTITGAQPIVQRFDLAAMFSQALASSLDECLATPLPTWAAPVTDVAQIEVGNLTYQAQRTLGSSWAYTFLWLEMPSDDAPDWAGYGSAVAVVCGIDGIGVGFYGLGLDRDVSIEGDTVSVSYSADGGAEVTRVWDVLPWGSWYIVSPQDDNAFYAAIKDADSLTITVASDPEFVETYDFAGNGFWTTPVQPNLDACVGS